MKLQTAKELTSQAVKFDGTTLVQRGWQIILERIEVNPAPKMDQTYWYISDQNIIREWVWTGTTFDKYRLVTSNVFLTRKEAEKRHDQIIDDIGEL